MKAINILLVEDNPKDLLLAQEAIAHCQTDIHLHIASSGQDALDFLEKHAISRSAKAPSLVLLDLKLEGMDSLAFLQIVRKNPRLRYLPVIIMSAHLAWQEARRFYTEGANSYLPKPLDLEEYQHILQEIEMFWVEACALPGNNHFAMDAA